MSNFETWWEREGQEFLFALNTTTDDDIKLVAEIAWKNGAYCAEQAEQEPVIDLSKVRHEDKCRYWDDETFCDCGADSHALLEWHRNNKAALREALGENNGCTNNIGDEKRNSNNDRNSALVSNSSEALAEPDIEEMTLTQIAAKHEQAAKKSVERHVENVYERGDKYFAWIGDNYVQIYTAPVRTKDLTDDEIRAIRFNWKRNEFAIDFARAVIAADREKNCA